MSIPTPTLALRHRERGGITILVALMLLVFITIVAVGMSRNSFREIVISGTSRQGALVRDTADSGIEWSIFWMDLENAKSSTDTAASLAALKTALLQDPSLSGKPYDASQATPTLYDISSPPSAPADLTWTSVGGTDFDASVSIALTRMGKLPITNMSQGLGPGAFAPAQGNENKQAPDLWAIRSDAQISTGLLGSTFIHSKEAWITTPVQ